MRRVVLESPYAARDPQTCLPDWHAHVGEPGHRNFYNLADADAAWVHVDRDANVAYARSCLLDCLRRGEGPIASHLLIPQVLDDLKPLERELGIAAGLAWHDVADAIVFYTDRGWSRGMRYAHEYAVARSLVIEYRSLTGEPVPPQ